MILVKPFVGDMLKVLVRLLENACSMGDYKAQLHSLLKTIRLTKCFIKVGLLMRELHAFAHLFVLFQLLQLLSNDTALFKGTDVCSLLRPSLEVALQSPELRLTVELFQKRM